MCVCAWAKLIDVSVKYEGKHTLHKSDMRLLIRSRDLCDLCVCVCVCVCARGGIGVSLLVVL